MKEKIRMATQIGMLLVAMACMATPALAANMNLAGGSDIRVSGWNTQSYRSFTTVIPVSAQVYTNSQPAYLYGMYSNLNSYLSAGPLIVNKNAISIPSMATSNNNWDSLFGQTPGFMYSCGC
jgi:hypothetical protein